jgi:pantothenate kinase
VDKCKPLARGSGSGAAPAGGAGRWRFVIGLVGKPSAGKSTLFNAATELREGKAWRLLLAIATS